ncbi:hypothetical protein ACLQ24_28045 [Micromonospora sp. DT4]|uniref:hypothetical protein n=1 Tax=Micromonospora sp. DT4 TaxID=3393438 RepID=UPI003CF84836
MTFRTETGLAGHARAATGMKTRMHEVRERLRVGRELRHYMSDLVERARLAPGDDMIGMLIREHGRDLTHAGLAAVPKPAKKAYQRPQPAPDSFAVLLLPGPVQIVDQLGRHGLRLG